MNREKLGLPEVEAGTPLRENLQQICTELGLETGWVKTSGGSGSGGVGVGVGGSGGDSTPDAGASSVTEETYTVAGGGPLPWIDDDDNDADRDPWLVWEQHPDLFNRSQGVRILTAADYIAPRTFYIREWERVWIVLSCTPEQPRQCGPYMSELWTSLAAAFTGDPRVEVALVTVLHGSPEQTHAARYGAGRAGTIQLFHMDPKHYAAGVNVPVYRGLYTLEALKRQVRLELGEHLDLYREDLLAVLLHPVIRLGGGTLVMCWLVWRAMRSSFVYAEETLVKSAEPLEQALRLEQRQLAEEE
eukprot:COSAG05_NODE_3243_length_2213_cov_67.515571_1_plen_301_part_10